MHDLQRLRECASDLRERINDFMSEFGRDMVPEFRRLRDELDQIDVRLKAPGEHRPDEDGRD